MARYRISHQVVDRLYITATTRDVVRAVHKAMVADALTRKNREARHKAIRDALLAHEENKDLYIAATKGALHDARKI